MQPRWLSYEMDSEELRAPLSSAMLSRDPPVPVSQPHLSSLAFCICSAPVWGIHGLSLTGLYSGGRTVQDRGTRVMA